MPLVQTASSTVQTVRKPTRPLAYLIDKCLVHGLPLHFHEEIWARFSVEFNDTDTYSDNRGEGANRVNNLYDYVVQSESMSLRDSANVLLKCAQKHKSTVAAQAKYHGKDAPLLELIEELIAIVEGGE